MENQHRKISGYRELSQEEIDLMNEIKALGPKIEAVLLKVGKHISEQRSVALGGTKDFKLNIGQAVDPLHPEQLDRLEAATPERFIALAKTDFQTALMYLTRAVAQPTFF